MTHFHITQLISARNVFKLHISTSHHCQVSFLPPSDDAFYFEFYIIKMELFLSFFLCTALNLCMKMYKKYVELFEVVDYCVKL